MSSLEQRIKAIKEKNSRSIIEKAKAEERLKHLDEQKAQIEQQCQDLGVNPLDLDAAIANETEAVEKLTKEAEAHLGITEDQQETPF